METTKIVLDFISHICESLIIVFLILIFSESMFKMWLNYKLRMRNKETQEDEEAQGGSE